MGIAGWWGGGRKLDTGVWNGDNRERRGFILYIRDEKLNDRDCEKTPAICRKERKAGVHENEKTISL